MAKAVFQRLREYVAKSSFTQPLILTLIQKSCTYTTGGTVGKIYGSDPSPDRDGDGGPSQKYAAAAGRSKYRCRCRRKYTTGIATKGEGGL